jgi:putative ABC transport system permease protein
MLLRRVSLAEFRKHLLRNALTLTGIILGVAIFSAVRSANSTLIASLRDTIDQLAGKAVLQATAGQAGMPESAVEVILAVPGVRAAAPVIEAVVRTGEASQGNILILGVDMAGDRTLRDYRLEGEEEDAVSDPLIFLAQPDSLIVSGEFAERNGLGEESAIDLVTAVGRKQFTVRGIMQPRGLAKAFGGNIGVMDIYSAQYVFGRGRTFDRIDIALEDGVAIDDVLPDIRAALGPGYTVEPPLRRGKQTESLLAAYTSALFFSSVIALTIGLFLIFNVFSVNVTQRRTQIGVLRALGVTRARIQHMFLTESLLLGIAGSGLGIAAGVLMGRAIMTAMATVIRDTYGVLFQTDRLQVDPFWTILSFFAGILASLLGAYLPARAAARIEPALALQKGKYQVLYLGENRTRRIAGLLLMLACLALGLTPWARAFSTQLVIYIVLFVSLAVLAPTFSHLCCAAPWGGSSAPKGNSQATAWCRPRAGPAPPCPPSCSASPLS